MAIGIGPVGAWIAITGTFDWQPIFLAAAVACWIAGFDTMYACQDIEFDRNQGLYSIPARFGEEKGRPYIFGRIPCFYGGIFDFDRNYLEFRYSILFRSCICYSCSFI